MKNIKLAKNFILTFVMFLAVGLSVCSCEKDIDGIPANHGEVSFRFDKITTYDAVNELTDIESIIIVLSKNEHDIILPSLLISGTNEMISTKLHALEEGTYKVKSYVAYDRNANIILESGKVKDNEFIIIAGQKIDFNMPIMVKDVIVPNNIKNVLLGICIDTFGPDTLNWKVSWRDNKDIDKWENIEFNYDEFNEIVGVLAVTFDDKFAEMTYLNPSIINLGSLESLVIRDNNLEFLPEEIGKMNIHSLTIMNTNISFLPESAKLLNLGDLTLKGNKFTEFPDVIPTLEDISLLTIIDENISSIPEEIGNLGKLRALTINGTNITSLPNVFDKLFRISTLNFSNNKNLTSLPATIKPERHGRQLSYLRAIHLNDCGFTSIPQELISPKFKLLSLGNNKITTVDKLSIESLPNLHTLVLDGNSLSSFPMINSESIAMLSLINTGLSRADVDSSGMPSLVTDRVIDGITYSWLLFTQEEYDLLFSTSIPNDLYIYDN